MNIQLLQSGISQGVIVIEADRNSGTMHTADFAVSQYRRLACYYHRLLGNATGNKYLEDSADAKVIRQLSNLEEFVNDVLSDGQYEQLSLQFLQTTVIYDYERHMIT